MGSKRKFWLKSLKSLLRRILPNFIVTLLRGRRPAWDFVLTQSLNIDLAAKLRILKQFEAVNQHVGAEHAEPEIFEVVNGLIRLNNAGIDGVVVECGTFKGASTCKLSIVARHLGRRVFAFDSFQGLPETAVYSGNWGRGVTFDKGGYAADYSVFLQSLRNYGEAEVTTVVKGWFQDTLPGFDEPIALLLLDVDLLSSTKTCLHYLWPKLVAGAFMFSHDGHVGEIEQLFRNARYWTAEFGENPPEFIGLGQKKLVLARKRTAIPIGLRQQA